MTGNNSLEVNEATMKEIVEYWLTNKFLSKDANCPKVAGVKPTSCNGCHTFEIKLESPVDVTAR